MPEAKVEKLTKLKIFSNLEEKEQNEIIKEVKSLSREIGLTDRQIARAVSRNRKIYLNMRDVSGILNEDSISNIRTRQAHAIIYTRKDPMNGTKQKGYERRSKMKERDEVAKQATNKFVK